MVPTYKKSLIFLMYKTHWGIKERWGELFSDLKDRGLTDDRSEWIISFDEKGGVVIFNQCALPAEVFKIFNQEFFDRIRVGLGKQLETVTRFSFENTWESYVRPSSVNNGAFRQVGWRLRGTIFSEEPDDIYSAEAPVTGISRKIMD